MNTFGLGLVLSFTDNATSGLNRASGAFQNLNSTTAAFSNANGAEAALLQVASAANIVGNEMYNVGQGITSLFTGIIQQVTETGSTLMSARSQLATLYGEAGNANYEAGEAILGKIKDYAAQSIFNFEDLIPSVIMLKAHGIEAFDEIATSAYRATGGVEGYSQTLMDYAADLAAFNPTMHNMYGEGVQAAMGALNEYIAEGNAMSLKRGASIDILQLLGEEKGKTIEERSRQVADLMEQLGMVGMTANLAGTATQRLSNVEDVFFNLLSNISDSGVFEKYTELVTKFTDYLFSIPDEELESIAQVLADALVEIMDPLEKVIDLGIQAVDWIRELVATHPDMVKSATKSLALAGAFTVLGGAALKLLSALGMLRFSIQMLFGIGSLQNGIKIIGLLKGLALYVLPVIAAVALLKAAWDRDFMGMQEKLTEFVHNVWDSFKLIVDAFQDNTLSKDNFKRAQELGILPLIEGILLLKYYWQFFVEGFKVGLESFWTGLEKVIVKLQDFGIDLSDLYDKVVAFIQQLTAPGAEDTWRAVGETVGEIVGWLAVAIAMLPVIVKTLTTVWTIVTSIIKVISFLSRIPGWISSIVTWFSSLGPFFTSIGAWFSSVGAWITGTLWPALQAIGSAIMGALTAIATALGISVGWLIVIIAIVIAIIAVVWIFRDEIAAFLVEAWWAVEDFFIGIGQWFVDLWGKFTDWVSNVWTSIKNFFSGVWQGIKDTASRIAEFFSGVWQEILNNPIVQFFGNLIKAVYGFFYMMFWLAVLHCKTMIEAVVNAATAVIEWVKGIWNAIVTFVVGVWNEMQANLIKFWEFIVNLGAQIGQFIWSIFQAVAGFFQYLWTDVISPFVQVFINAYQAVVDWVSDNFIAPIAQFFSDLFDGIAGIVHWLCDEVFAPVFNAIRDAIETAIQAAYDFVSPILQGIADFINSIIDGISNVINTASEWVGGIGDFFISVGDNAKSMVGLATGGYVNTEGIAMLHPNEVVVNDTLTKGLGTFLSDYETAKRAESPLLKQDIVADDDYQERDEDFPIVIDPEPFPTGGNDDDNNPQSPMQALAETTNVTNDNSMGDTNNDNSVVFETGSIVLNIDGSDLGDMTDEELNQLAEKLMRIISRKMQLRNMQTRK